MPAEAKPLPVNSPTAIESKRAAVHELMLRVARYLKTEDIEVLAGPDLRVAYEAYDELFFQTQLSQLLESSNSRTVFFSSARLTSAGANIRAYADIAGGRVYRIAVSAPVLFASFTKPGETLSVDGILCSTRLQSLLILMEHELVHLYEMLTRGTSGHGASFKSIAMNTFGHTAFQHALVTPKQVAAETFHIRQGDRVSFSYEGRRKVGQIERITRRATVMVPGPKGSVFKFYVPLAALTKVKSAGG